MVNTMAELMKLIEHVWHADVRSAEVETNYVSMKYHITVIFVDGEVWSKSYDWGGDGSPRQRFLWDILRDFADAIDDRIPPGEPFIVAQ